MTNIKKNVVVAGVQTNMVSNQHRMSICHFRPCIIAGTPDGKKTQIICTFCRQPADFVPDFFLEQTNVELTLHRFKEGAYSTEDAVDAINEISKRALVELLDKVGRIKYPTK